MQYFLLMKGICVSIDKQSEASDWMWGTCSDPVLVSIAPSEPFVNTKLDIQITFPNDVAWTVLNTVEWMASVDGETDKTKIKDFFEVILMLVTHARLQNCRISKVCTPETYITYLIWSLKEIVNPLKLGIIFQWNTSYFICCQLSQFPYQDIFSIAFHLLFTEGLWFLTQQFRVLLYKKPMIHNNLRFSLVSPP